MKPAAGGEQPVETSGDSSSRLTDGDWRAAKSRDGNWLVASTTAQVLAGEIAQSLIDVGVFRDAQQFVTGFRTADTRKTVETRTSRLIVFRAGKDSSRDG